jgi:hypothetical protein
MTPWFWSIISGEKISAITGLENEELDEFLLFLHENLSCDLHCTELELYTEIHQLWDEYNQKEKSESSPD